MSRLNRETLFKIARSARRQPTSEIRPPRAAGSAAPGRGGRQHLGARRMTGYTVLVMIALVLSKFTGQIRDILAVSLFRHGDLTDAYIQGFLIPDFVYELLIGGSIQAAIIPTLSGSLERGEGRRGWHSVSILISYACVTMLAVVLVGEIAAPLLLAPLTSATTLPLATQVTRVLFPQTYLMMLAALSIGVLNAYNRFDRTAFGPVVYNLCVIVSLLVFGHPSADAVVRVAAGVTASALVFFLLQAGLARRELQNFRPSLDHRDPGFRRLLIIALPTLAASAIPPFNNILLNAIIQSVGLPAGSTTSLRNATTLWMLPWGVFAVAVGQVMLPSLSALNASGRYREAGELLGASLRRALFLTIPSGVIYLALRQDIVRAVFQWRVSSYGESAVEMTAGLLLFYSVTIVTHTFVYITNQAFFSIRNTRIPLLGSLLSMFLTTTLGYLGARFTPLGTGGLSLGYASASLINAVVLQLLYRRTHPRGRARDMRPFVTAAVPAAVFTLLALLVVEWLAMRSAFFPAGKLVQLLWLALRVALGFLVWFLSSIALGVQEALALVKRLLSLFGFVRRGADSGVKRRL
ncbi:MAG: murein biosynthesis integral membrane protein MurJ [Bacillota bacterium]|nr:murein biosynthesis integral membrane protein MurJ [Bacillota bacterium]